MYVPFVTVMVPFMGISVRPVAGWDLKKRISLSEVVAG
jgi:hypothetical protein